MTMIHDKLLFSFSLFIGDNKRKVDAITIPPAGCQSFHAIYVFIAPHLNVILASISSPIGAHTSPSSSLSIGAD